MISRRLWGEGGNSRDQEVQRSVRSRNGRRRRGVSWLCLAVVVGVFLLAADHVFFVSLQKHLDHGQGDHKENLPLEVPSLVALEEGRVQEARRGGSSSGDGSAKTAWTPHSEINGAESAKPRIASAPSATAPVAGAVGVTADRRSSRIASAPSATAPVAGAVGVTDDRRSFRTLTWLREGQCEVSDCRVLITGSGRSGTHFLTEQFQGAGIPISHETIGKAGAISWVHAAPFREELRELEEWFSNHDSVELRSSKDFQFFPLFHMVRHPVAALTSLTECFCGCGSMTCGGWADPPSWKWAGKFVEFSDRHCSRMINNEVCADHKHPNGRLIRSMEYWLQWNELAGSQAHYRLQLETVNLSEVVEAASLLGTHMVSSGGASPTAFKQKPFSSKRRGRRTVKTVTWEAMRSADAGLEAKVWELAQSYGYSRDAP